MNSSYLQVIQIIPEIHRRFMHAIKKDLEILMIHDINNIQALMLFKIGDSEISFGELMSRGVYIGSNASYHVKKMVENGYLMQEHTPYDRRVSWLRLTEKGRNLREELTAAHQRRIEVLSQVAVSPDELHAVSSVLQLLDRFWTDVAERLRRSP